MNTLMEPNQQFVIRRPFYLQIKPLVISSAAVKKELKSPHGVPGKTHLLPMTCESDSSYKVNSWLHSELEQRGLKGHCPTLK